MTKLLICLLGSVVAASQLLAATNLVVAPTNSPPATAPGAGDAVEKEFKQIMEADDAAQAEADQWIRENDEAAAKGAGVPSADLRRRIHDRFGPIRAAYEDFLQRHPDHARARVAYGSFLNDLHDEEGAQAQWEKALALNPKDPAVYNNLANLYGHIGPIKKAFEYYAKAIELNPREALYYDNFGTAVFLFRKDAMEFFAISEQQVFDKALDLYSKALKLDPTNFPLASPPRPTTGSNRSASRMPSTPGLTPWPWPTTRSSVRASIFTSPASSSRPTGSLKSAPTWRQSPTKCMPCSKAVFPATWTSRSGRSGKPTRRPRFQDRNSQPRGDEK